MIGQEGGAGVAELVRRICIHAPSLDPVPAMATTLEAMAGTGVAIGDVYACLSTPAMSPGSLASITSRSNPVSPLKRVGPVVSR